MRIIDTLQGYKHLHLHLCISIKLPQGRTIGNNHKSAFDVRGVWEGWGGVDRKMKNEQADNLLSRIYTCISFIVYIIVIYILYKVIS